MHWNNDVVTALPTGAAVLARTPQGELQAARYAPPAWGVQLHPEADAAVVAPLGRVDREDHLAPGVDQDGRARPHRRRAAASWTRPWRPLAAAFARTAPGGSGWAR